MNKLFPISVMSWFISGILLFSQHLLAALFVLISPPLLVGLLTFISLLIRPSDAVADKK